MTVLLIEDDVEARELLSDLLSLHGATVVSVGTCAAGIALLEGGMVPDVILSDVKLPDDLGTIVLAYIDARPQLRHTRTALVTGSPELAPRGAKVFVKPIKVAELIAFVG